MEGRWRGDVGEIATRRWRRGARSRTVPLTLTCTLTCTLTLTIALTPALPLHPNQETGVLCEHVYVGLPWERPTAMGCCYFHARDVSGRPFEPATHGVGLQTGCR